MKYIALAIVSAFAGFFGAWLLFQEARVSPPGTANGLAGAPPIPSARDGIESSSNTSAASTRALEFEDIARAGTVFDQLYTAWQLAAQAPDPAALEALVRQAAASRDPLYTNNVASILMERYVTFDPAAAMDFVDREPRLNQISMKAHVLTSWIRHDPETAIDFLRDVRSQQVLMASSALLLQDPALAASGLRDEIIELIGEERANQLQTRIEVQRGDPAELFSTATLMRGDERRTRMQLAVSRWVQTDPEAALRAVATLPIEFERNRMLNIAMNAYAQSDPMAAYEYARLNLPGQPELLVQPIGALAARDIQSALQLAETYRQEHGDMSAMSRVLNRWAREDPAQALAHANTLPTDAQREVLPMLANVYMQREPEAAMRWLLSLGREYTNVKQSAIQIRSVDTMRVGERLLPSVTDSAVRRQLISQIATFKSLSDADSALQWLSAYEDEPAFASALPNIVGSLAQRDPARAARLIENRLSEADSFGLIHTVARNWIDRSPDEATGWLASLPESQDRNNAIMSLSSFVARRSGLDAAVDLIETLPEGSSYRKNGANQVAMNYADYSTDRLEEAIRELDITGEDAERLRRQLRAQ